MTDFDPHTYDWAKCVPELLVDEFNRSLGFYQMLGFTAMYQRDGFAYLDYHNAQLMIAQRNDWWETATMERPYGRGVNLQFSTHELDALIDRLTTANIALYEAKQEKWRDLGSHQGGSWEFLVQDPDGYLLRFLQVIER